MYRRLLNWVALSLLGCSVWSLPAGANRTSDSAELLLSGDQFVITASKRAQPIQQVPAAVTVITDKDIERMGALTLIDALRYAPGVDVCEPNAAVANVSIRGLNDVYADKVLVMVDGRSIYQDNQGGVYWHTEPLLLSSIKRIEIIRGPGSALYGANAFNGVINIITKTPVELAKAGEHGNFRTAVGSEHTAFTELSVNGGKVNGWSYNFGSAYNTTRGLGGREPGKAHDSYAVPTFTLDTQRALANGSLRITVGNAEGRADYNESVPIMDGRWHTSNFTVLLNQNRAKYPWQARAYVNSFLQTGPAGDEEQNNTTDLELQQTRPLGRGQTITYGASYRHTRGSAITTNMVAHQQDLWALFTQAELKFGRRTRLFAGGRADQNSLYGLEYTPRVSLVQHLAADQTLRLSYGTAFHAPTLQDTYWNMLFPVGHGLFQKMLGDRNLKPERITSYEVGWRRDTRRGFSAVNLYHNDVVDLLNFIPTAFYPSPPYPPHIPQVLQRINLDRAEVNGLELETEQRLSSGARLVLNYAYENVVSDTGLSLSPHHKVNARLETRLSSKWDAMIGAHYVGSTAYVHSSRTSDIPAYAVADMRLGYHFERSPWALSLIVNNLFDDKHFEFPATIRSDGLLAGAPNRRNAYLMLTGKL